MPTLEFRGAMLFVIRQGKIRSAVFPDTRQVPPGGSVAPGGKKKHFDTSDATPHFAGILVRRSDGTFEGPIDLTDARVELDSAVDWVDESAIRDLPDVASEAPQCGLSFGSAFARACVVDLKVPGSPQVDVTWPEQPFFTTLGGIECPLTVRYEFPQDVVIKYHAHGPPPPSIQLSGADVAIIYHFDVENPSWKDLTAEREIDARHTEYFDHDFKWMYSLCHPRPATQSCHLSPLSAPRWSTSAARVRSRRDAETITERMTIRVSTCFPARIGT